MFSRIKRSLGLALLLALLTSMTVFAKGGFSFITVAGPDIKAPVKITDTALTISFFAFANFYEDKTQAPSDPGEGFEITRYYLDGKREIAFDQLHYYPETGFVFYDGIVNGDSEYDDEWYKANPDVRNIFETAILAQTQPAKVSLQAQLVEAVGQVPASTPQNQVMMVIFAAGLVIVFVFIFWLRKPVTR